LEPDNTGSSPLWTHIAAALQSISVLQKPNVFVRSTPQFLPHILQLLRLKLIIIYKKYQTAKVRKIYHIYQTNKNYMYLCNTMLNTILQITI